MKLRIVIASAVLTSIAGAPIVMAQDKCPVELRDAKAKVAAAAKSAPRAAASYQGGSSEAPRATAGYQGGSGEAPRAAAGYQGGSSEAPRAAAGYQGGSGEAPRAAAGYQGGSSEAPRATAGAKAPDSAMLAKARKLIAEAEADCKKGDMAASSEKAKAALEALK